MRPVYLWASVKQTFKACGLSCLLALGALYIISSLVNYITLYYISGILLLMPVFAPLVTKWIPKKRISPDGRAIFITGCDSGFGHLLAIRLDELGFKVFAGCLFPDGDGATTLRNTTSNLLHVISLDVTSDISVQQAATYVKENLDNNLLWAVVNNAGIAASGEVSWTSMETFQRIIDVNTLGVVRVSKAFLPKLKDTKGRIITVASLAGRTVLAGAVPYSISKMAAIGFSDGLRLEIGKWDVEVITIEPTFYRTAMTSEKTIADSIREQWRIAPKEVKDMYSATYVEKYAEIAADVIKPFFRDPREVVAVIEEAIMSSCPDYHYVTGSLVFKLIYWLKLKLPDPLFEFLAHYSFSPDF